MIPCYTYPYYPTSYDQALIPVIYGAFAPQCLWTRVECSCEKKKKTKKKTTKKQCESCRSRSKPIQYIDCYQWHANLPI